MNTKVSIIIPVYNAEAYLRTSIDSAIKQTLKEIEIIIVDDCSRDSSLRVMHDYATQDNRIRILKHVTNKGEGFARNTGLDAARGDYVFHLDADDTIPPNALELLYSQAEKHGSELVKGSFAFIYDDDTATPSTSWPPPPKTINTNIYESSYLQTIPTSHCSYLYNRSFLEKFGIRYPQELTIGLDLVSLTTALLNTEKVTLIPDIVYHYHQTQISATRGALSEKIILDAITARKTVYELLMHAQLTDAARDYIRRWPWQITEYWVNMAQNHTPEVCSRVFSEFRALVSHRVVPWQDNVAHNFRYLLALVLAAKDKDAIHFLRSEAFSEGFSNSDKLVAALEFVLTQVADDSGALCALGRQALNENKLERAVALYQRVVQSQHDHLDARLKLVSALTGLGQYDQAREQLKIAQVQLEKTPTGGLIFRQYSQQLNRLAKEEQKVVVKNLHGTHIQMETTRKDLAGAQNALKKKRGEHGRHELTGSTLSDRFPALPGPVNYLINWSEKNKIIYVETPKVGCTTIKQILQYSEFDYDRSRMPDDFDDIHDRGLSPLKSPKDNEAQFIICLESEDYFTFSFVRNPFTRTLSAYLDKIVGQPGTINHIQKKMGIDPSVNLPTFSEFVDIVYNQRLEEMNPHWAPQTFLLGYQNVAYDFLGRFEFFDDSINQLLTRTSLKIPDEANRYGKKHATGAEAKKSDYFSPGVRNRLQEIYYDDFKYLGYGWSL